MFKQNISREVWGGNSGKYRLKGPTGECIDKTPEDSCQRVAKGLADVELENKEYWEEKFASLMIEGKMSGGGRIMANVGSGDLKRSSSPINCVVSGQIADSMQDILQKAKDAAMVLKAGCGIGFDFSTIRPKGAYVFGSGSVTSGVLSFMKIYDATCNTVMSGGGRRGAQLACLNVAHPEIEEYISCKRQDGTLRYFNLSVGISDVFMQAVKDDKNWNLWFWKKLAPNEKVLSEVCMIEKDSHPFYHSEYDFFSFEEDHVEVVEGNCTVDTVYKKVIFKTIKAQNLFDLIMKSNYDFAEPGLLFLDKINQDNVLSFCEKISTANPCVAEGTLVNTPSGYRKAEDIQVGDLATTPIGPQKVTIREVNDNCDIYEVKFSDGGVQRVTSAHKYAIMKNGTSKKRFEPERLSETNIGDWVSLFPGSFGVEHMGTDEDYKYGLMQGVLIGGGKYAHKFLEPQLGSNDRLENCITITTNVADELYNDNVKKLFSKITRFGDDEVSKHSRSMKITILDGWETLNYLKLEQKYSYEKSIDVLAVNTQSRAVGILDGLLATDGDVDLRSDHPQIRWVTSSFEVATGIKQLLNLVGAHAFLTTSNEKGENEREGADSKKHAKHTITISGESVRQFAMKSRIGELHPEKGRRRVSVLCDNNCSGNEWRASIKSIEKVDNGRVFDLYVNGDKWLTSGYMQLSCGEQCLPPDASCLLGSMILPPYVADAFSDSAAFDWESFNEDVRTATRMLDNVVDINNLPLKKLDEQIRLKRRHGLGFTGLGTIFNMLGMPYGGAKSVAFSDKLMFVIARTSLEENVKLAKEKGPAPIFMHEKNRILAMESGYLSRLLAEIGSSKLSDEILKYGLRFSHATSIAPTGTMSLTWGDNCSNGIEPSFSNSYLRNIRIPGKKTKTQEEVMSLEYLLWKEKYGDLELPSWWRVTDDLTVSEHVGVQAAVQRWNDSAISKTINVPTDYPFEDFKKVYMNAWECGLKGVTTFRFNPEAFSGVLVKKEDLDNTKYVFILDDGSEVSVAGSDEIEYDGEMHNAANLFDALKEGMYGDM